MTNEERDTIVKEIHSAVISIDRRQAVSDEIISRHDRSLYHDDIGVCRRVDILEASSKSAISIIATIIAVIAAIGAWLK